MRIIAGRARSLTLSVPEQGTRPTSDRVKESLFGALESAGLIEDAAVLDLYAGSGALALEALSRGAARADLVERSAKAAAVAERNARTVGSNLPGTPIRVHRAGADAFLRQSTAVFDLVFVDPPYDLAEDELTHTLELLAPRLSAEATVVIERATRSGEPALPASLQVDRQKTYGETTLWWVGPA